ncbi:hypothetical protein MMC24_002665 [Lignoscripta atroalba]|nr:hypothetical protein [Lignoscripta atroalba]
MPIKWTPENDQLLLLKILETSAVQADVKAISAAWPTDRGETPTPRSITERLVKIRSVAKANGAGHFSVSSAQAKGIRTPSATPSSTPRKLKPAGNGNGVVVTTPTTTTTKNGGSAGKRKRTTGGVLVKKQKAQGEEGHQGEESESKSESEGEGAAEGECSGATNGSVAEEMESPSKKMKTKMKTEDGPGMLDLFAEDAEEAAEEAEDGFGFSAFQEEIV